MIIWMLYFGLMNYLRGWGPTDHYAKPPLWRKLAAHLTSKVGTGIFAGFFVFFSLWLGADRDGLASLCIASIVALGWWLWALRGWGDYWDFSSRKNQEVRFLDALVLRFLPPGELNDLLSMSLRGFIFGYPLFLALAWALGSLTPLCWGLGLLLQGPVYWLQNRGLRKRYNVHKHGNDLSESLMGVVWGLLLWAAIL